MSTKTTQVQKKCASTIMRGFIYHQWNMQCHINQLFNTSSIHRSLFFLLFTAITYTRLTDFPSFRQLVRLLMEASVM